METLDSLRAERDDAVASLKIAEETIIILLIHDVVFASQVCAIGETVDALDRLMTCPFAPVEELRAALAVGNFCAMCGVVARAEREKRATSDEGEVMFDASKAG